MFDSRLSVNLSLCVGNKVNKGFGLLEWTGAVVPQGLLVKGDLP